MLLNRYRVLCRRAPRREKSPSRVSTRFNYPAALRGARRGEAMRAAGTNPQNLRNARLRFLLP